MKRQYGIYITLKSGEEIHVNYNDLRAWKNFADIYTSSDVDSIEITAKQNKDDNIVTMGFRGENDIRGFEVCNLMISEQTSNPIYYVGIFIPSQGENFTVLINEKLEMEFAGERPRKRRKVFYLK